MSQTARVKTVINDLETLKKAIKELGWSYSEASDKVTLDITTGSRGTRINASAGSDGKYTFSGDFGYGQNNVMNNVNKKYAQLKLYKEINSRSNHGITSLSEAIVMPDGRIVIEGEIDESLLVG